MVTGMGRGRTWTIDERRILRERYAEDGPEAVAALLGRTVEAVTAKACQFGIKTGAPHNGRAFTAAEDRAILSLRAAGLNFAEMTREIPGRRRECLRKRWMMLAGSWATKRTRAEAAGRREARHDDGHSAEPSTVMLHCLKCRRPFESVDRRSNRLCLSCRMENAAFPAGYFDIGTPSSHVRVPTRGAA